MDGIIVLDKEGKTDCEYSTDESLANEITEYLQKEIIMDFAGYEEKILFRTVCQERWILY